MPRLRLFFEAAADFEAVADFEAAADFKAVADSEAAAAADSNSNSASPILGEIQHLFKPVSPCLNLAVVAAAVAAAEAKADSDTATDLYTSSPPCCIFFLGFAK